ncbi:MAG: protein kinase [Chloroflexi bacterium]|nr:protein kinase [Chloroflexota bacterium]
MSLALIGQTLLSQYRIEEFIAPTPLGRLYRAADTRSNKPLALTLLPKAVAEDAEIIKDLDAKSQKLRALSASPNLITYLGLRQTPTLAFLLEEWVDGPPLSSILQKTPLPAAEILIYVRSLCAALEVLHGQNYLHLNLAPELIRVNKQGEVFLGGIGAARQIGGEAKEGKWGNYPRLYDAPEKFEGGALTPATDIYALAVLVYQLATGEWINGKPAPKTAEAVKRVHLEITPPAPVSLNVEIPDHFSRMILWALRKNPDERLKSTTEFLSALALAARSSMEEIPKRLQPPTAPVSASVLEDWNFLPPPQTSIIKQNVPSLQERLVEIERAQPKKSAVRFGVVSALVFALTAGFLSLFWLARPAPEASLPTPIQFTPFAADYTPPPTFTPLPKPTDPKGGRIAFTCTRGDYNQICMINRDGSGLIQLSDMEASNYYPVFTPGGEGLLFASNRNGPFDLYLLIFGEKQLIQITKNVGNVVSPDYSPDGRRIVFVNRAGTGTASIWMVNADGLNPRLVYAGAEDIVAVAWSPDGERIAYAMSSGAPQEYEIFTMNVEGKNHVRISRGLQGIGGSLSWSPDGKSLLIHAGPAGDKNIFKLEVADGAYTQLTDGGNNAGASYSPDGRYIVFNSLRNDNQADLYIMRADGTNQVQLTNHPEPDWGARWVE